MSRVRKTREQMANEFFVSVCEIDRLFGLGRTKAKACFEECKKTEEAVGLNFNPEHKVRLNTVIRVLGISNAELKRKIKDPP